MGLLYILRMYLVINKSIPREHPGRLEGPGGGEGLAGGEGRRLTAGEVHGFRLHLRRLRGKGDVQLCVNKN